MRYTTLLAALTGILSFTACSDDDNPIPTQAPDSYTFTRNDESTVSFSGQTTRIMMAEELAGSLMDFSTTTEHLLELYRNQTAAGGDANPYADEALNASTKSVKNKVAASADYFSTNSVGSAQIKADFEEWITEQVDEVFPAQQQVATPGTPGQLADGSSTRYVNAQGLEYDQMIVKGLIGALMTDQALNNYLSSTVLDAGDNISNNNEEITEEGKPYTTMEHKWDEAYGYVYGLNADAANPNADLGADSFINKYLGRLEGDEDFAGTAEEIFEAFKLGRAAIVAKDYNLRDDQADIIREKLSEMIGIRAVYYMIQGKLSLPDNREAYNLYGPAFHDLSEGYGFIYSLQFTRKPGTDEPYLSAGEVAVLLTKLTGDGPNGLWDVESTTLDEIASTIADKFSFTVDQAGS